MAVGAENEVLPDLLDRAHRYPASGDLALGVFVFNHPEVGFQCENLALGSFGRLFDDVVTGQHNGAQRDLRSGVLDPRGPDEIVLQEFEHEIPVRSNGWHRDRSGRRPGLSIRPAAILSGVTA